MASTGRSTATVPEGMNELDEKLRVLIKIVRQKLNELYPYYYKRSFENRKDLTIVMNTSHKQFMDQLKAADKDEFIRLGLPWVTKSTIEYIKSQNDLKPK